MPLFQSTFSGTLGSSEVFAHTLWHENDDPLAGPGTALVTATTWLGNLFTAAVRAHYTSGVAYSKCRTVQYDPLTGGQLDAAEGPLVVNMTSLSSLMPYEVATVISHSTTTATRSGRGRFYLPPPHSVAMNGNTGTYTTTFLVDHLAGLTNAYGILTDATHRVVVVSKVGGAPWVIRDVSQVSIGSVPDAQRRRRNRQVEARSVYVPV